jgi:formate dehydrogenase major subunit
MGTPAEGGCACHADIDGIDVTVPEGTSVMRAAAEAGIQVPKLCATDSVEAFGSCRLCVVEIEGRRGTPASCTTPVAEGMVVHTQAEKVKKIRKGVMELYISDHPLDCLTCAANGDCELQDMAGAVGLRDVRYEAPPEGGRLPTISRRGTPQVRRTPSGSPKDDSNPYFTYDPSKCIVCSRCVRACEEVQGTFALTIEGRGFRQPRQRRRAGDDFLSSDCVSCGACVQACPTATLQEKSVIELGTPTRSVVTTCAYCGVGCSFKAELNGDELVRMVPYKHGKANRGHSCVKGRFRLGLRQPCRAHPEPDDPRDDRRALAEVSWEEAMAFAAGRSRASRNGTGASRSG